ncbi:unnamed protein product [Cylindrotheca closterium]|uniref:DUF4246 domain-containing protein n=1 Tax=Cylindrotheca closterium TaxID=2856 RepID=A0AAD2GAK2_9STRA|nr:unnamed protein product [Cylindrotheca closterium]
MTPLRTTFKPKSLSSKGTEMLNNQGALIAKIFSFVIEDTKGLADFRLVSKEWNANVRLHVLKDFGLRKICTATRHNNYCEELVKFGEGSFAGRLYKFDESFDFRFFISPKDKKTEGSDDAEDGEMANGDGPAWATTEALLFCKDDAGYGSESKKCVIEKSDSYDFLKDEASHFANYCHRITETKSFEDFASMVDDGITEGLFLCLQDLEHAKHHGFTINMNKDDYDTHRPVILSLRLPSDHGAEVVEIGGSKVVYLKVKIEMEPEDDMELECAYPFVDDYQNPNLTKDERHIYPTFVGYNVEENEGGGLSCQVPMTINFNDGLAEEMWEWGAAESFLPLDILWSKCQEQPVREGVAIADDFVPKALHNNLMDQIDLLVESQVVDYHPHSNNIVRDIIHPALYSYVKGVSPLLKSEEEIKALSLDPSIPEDDRIELEPKDYWGREYEASAKYQWLPTYFDVAEDGSCIIRDYINNLVPRSDHEELYGSLAQLFSQALPLIESVYGYCRVVKEDHIRDEDDDLDYNPKPAGPIEERPVSLRGQQLQVVTKIVDYELGPGQTYEGVWHVEGMSHEEIVATAIYFIDRDAEIEGGDILFKRAFHKQEAMFIYSSVDQTRPPELEDKIDEGLMPLGQVETLAGRLLVFPNSHVHKVTELKNTSTTKDTESKKKRRIIVFFLVNPERRIVSTREVAAQQEHAGGSMKRSDAFEHRLKLMEERKYTKQDWNVREIELCEH